MGKDKAFDGHGENIEIRPGDFENGDFTIECRLRHPDIGPPAGGSKVPPSIAKNIIPNDGLWHNITIEWSPHSLTTHGAEYIEGVLFNAVKTYNSNNELIEMHYTRAELVGG